MRTFHCPGKASALRADFLDRRVRAIVEKDGAGPGERIVAYWKAPNDPRQYGDVYQIVLVAHPEGILPGYAVYLVRPVGRSWRRWTRP